MSTSEVRTRRRLTPCRRKLSFYIPHWQGPIEGYVANYITRHGWKVERTQERSDLMQEAWIVFSTCAAAYPHMDTPQHFMALFKTAWSRHFIDLANADTAQRVELPLLAHRDEDGTELPLQEPIGEMENEGSLVVFMRQAPREVLLVLQLFLNAPSELLELALSSWTPDSLKKSSGNAYLNRALGLPAGYDAVGAVREYFDPAV